MATIFAHTMHGTFMYHPELVMQ